MFTCCALQIYQHLVSCCKISPYCLTFEFCAGLYNVFITCNQLITLFITGSFIEIIHTQCFHLKAFMFHKGRHVFSASLNRIDCEQHNWYLIAEISTAFMYQTHVFLIKISVNVALMFSSTISWHWYNYFWCLFSPKPEPVLTPYVTITVTESLRINGSLHFDFRVDTETQYYEKHIWHGDVLDDNLLSNPIQWHMGHTCDSVIVIR